jgi:hypothetical protein
MVTSGNKGKRKRDGNYSPTQEINLYRIQREIKKTDTQTQTPTRNPTKTTRTF